MHVAAHELRLFAHDLDHEWETSGRTGDQWLRSVLAYLNFRAGESWRRISSATDRNAPERWEYLHAARLIETLRHAPVTEPAIPKIVAPRTKRESLAINDLPRAVLADRLMRVNRRLTSRKLLMGLRKEKLAAMLIEAENAAPAEMERAS